MSEKEAKKTQKATAPKKAPAKKVAPKKEPTIKSAPKKEAKKEISFSIGEGRKYTYAVGKRKTAVARVRIYDNGEGKIEVNGKNIKDYFSGIFAQNATDALK